MYTGVLVAKHYKRKHNAKFSCKLKEFIARTQATKAHSSSEMFNNSLSGVDRDW